MLQIARLTDLLTHSLTHFLSCCSPSHQSVIGWLQRKRGRRYLRGVLSKYVLNEIEDIRQLRVVSRPRDENYAAAEYGHRDASAVHEPVAVTFATARRFALAAARLDGVVDVVEIFQINTWVMRRVEHDKQSIRLHQNFEQFRLFDLMMPFIGRIDVYGSIVVDAQGRYCRRGYRFGHDNQFLNHPEALYPGSGNVDACALQA